MRCLSNVCVELEDNPIDSWECVNCKGLSHHILPNNVADFHLQRDINHITVYCSQACMMSMDQTNSLYRNE